MVIDIIKGSKADNTTGDADIIVKGPKCGNSDFEDIGSVVMMFN